MMTMACGRMEALRQGKDKLKIALLLCARGLRPIAFPCASSLPVRFFSRPFAPRPRTIRTLAIRCLAYKILYCYCVKRALVLISTPFKPLPTRNTQLLTIACITPRKLYPFKGDRMAEPWLSVEKAAPYLGVSTHAVYRAISSGKFPFRVVRINRSIRIWAADIIAAPPVESETRTDAIPTKEPASIRAIA